MLHLGDYLADALIGFKFPTSVNGIPFTLAGSPAVSVWKTGVTAPIAAGVTLAVDYQGVTGLHDVTIDLSASASYAVAKDYQVYLSAGTVNGIPQVGLLLAQFSIEHRSIAAVAADVDTIGAAVAAILARTDGIAKNTALADFEFEMVLASDHVSPAAGLVVTATRSIDGGAFAACANAVAEVSGGTYKIDLAAADLNGDVITFKFAATGADATKIAIKTTS